MLKRKIVIKLTLISLTLVALSGCTFIIKDDNATKYYGVDKNRGSEFLNKVLDRQQEVYQGQKEVRK